MSSDQDVDFIAIPSDQEVDNPKNSVLLTESQKDFINRAHWDYEPIELQLK